MIRAAAVLLTAAGLFVSGCATTPEAKSPPPTALPLTPPSFPRVSLQQEMSNLGDTVRVLGERYAGGLVLTNGIEERAVPAANVRDEPYANVVAQLAEDTACAVEATPYYYFLYPPGYEALLGHHVGPTLHPRFAGLSAALAVGRNTPLFHALGLLGQNLGVTIIADNIVAEARCGELALSATPLAAILEALLKGARIAPEAVRIESTEEYVLIAASANDSRPNPQLGGAADARLDAVVTVRLPDLPVKPPREGSVFLLKEVLLSLSRQVDMPVAASAETESLPVIPFVYHGVRARTVVELLIRQWPAARYGYRVENGRIEIVSE